MTKLHEFSKFPVSVCTQEGELKSTEELVYAYIAEDENGIISFLPYVRPEKIYLSQHNSSIGETWKNHNLNFAKFLSNFEKNKIVDVGGGSGNIYNSFININDNVLWKIIDLNPPIIKSNNVEIIKGFYKPELISKNDTVITSHFLEHLFDVKNFLIELKKREPKFHIFTLPNFKLYAKNNYSATIMFEHPHYLAEDYLDNLLNNTGWKIVDKQYYKDHSIFYSTIPDQTTIVNKKFDHKNDILNFINYMKKRVDEIKHIKKFYVFGAHFTYYYLINMGIDENKIVAVVDNDPQKQNKRMYGTNTKIISTDQLPKDALVFLEMGPYNQEIKSKINSVKFI